MMRLWKKHLTKEFTRSLILITYTIHLAQPLAISRQLHSRTSNTSITVNSEHADDVSYENELTKPLWNGLTRNDRSTAARERRVRSVKQGKKQSKVKQQFVSIKLSAINVRKATIFCECKLSLAIMDNGDVRGLQNGSSSGANELFFVENFGKSMVALRSSKSRRYVAMNSKGKLYSTKSFTDEVVFKLLNSNHFPYKGFASYKYYKSNTFDMLLGIRRNGLPKRATKTSATKRDTKFLIIYTK